jgi:hypothetical protein
VQTTDKDATFQALQTTSVTAVMLGGFPDFSDWQGEAP